MIVAAVIAGIAPAIANRVASGMFVTPDGHRYASMGRGEKQPRPFSLRLVAKWMPPTTEAWDAVTFGSLILSVGALYFVALHMTQDVNIATGVCALYGALPYTRRLLVWPVLTDALSLCVVSMAGLLAVYASDSIPFVALCLLVFFGQYVHERATVHAALFAWFVSGSLFWFIPMGLGLVWYLMRSKTGPKHEDETAIDYLAHPFKTAWATHRKALFDYRLWLLPWGASLAWLLSPTWQLGLIAMASYAPCAMTVDRVRVYQANPFPFVIASCMVLPVEWWLPAYIFTLFISDGAV